MDPQVFIDIELAQLHASAQDYHDRGWRAVNICGSSVDGQVELIYSFSDNEELENLRLLVSNADTVPSISDIFLSTFFFENETHDLFGVDFKGIAIDFGGTFYPTSVPTPMNPASKQALAVAANSKAAQNDPATDGQSVQTTAEQSEQTAGEDGNG
ncbi:hypothetical protein FACS1894104_0370 [Actinomycetota bacterium]|nr:hypothetical protein FACS1894104_0370 [Actinomycetota bacterium]